MTLDESIKIPPGPPGNIHIFQEQDAVTISWQGTKIPLNYYIIYKRCDGESWKKLKNVRSAENNAEVYNIHDKSGHNCEYAISAVSKHGKEGNKSDPQKAPN